MDEQKRLRVLNGRLAADAYRQAHTKLSSGGWHKGISEEHTPLLNTMLAELKGQGFSSLDAFFNASEELNIKELGFADLDDFNTRAETIDQELSESKWQ